jgi:hypothetical protein
VADCFKFRNKIGLEVALEALREPIEKGLYRRSVAPSDGLPRERLPIDPP